MSDDGQDALILPILEQIGCELKDVTTISGFSGDQLYHAAAVVLRAVNPELRFNRTLPSGKAARFRLTSAIADEIKGLGYSQSNLGYESFMYPNPTEMRKLLFWLVERLPKSESKVDEDLEVSGDVLQQRRINAALLAWVRRGFNPVASKPSASVSAFRSVALALPSSSPAQPYSAAQRAYQADNQPLVHRQPLNPAGVLPSTLNHTSRALAAQRVREADWEAVNKDSGVFKARQVALDNLLAESFRTAHARAAEVAAHRVQQDLADHLNAHESAFNRRAQFTQEGADEAQILNEEGNLEEMQRLRQEQEDERQAKLQADRQGELNELQQQIDALHEKRKKMESAQDNFESTRIQSEAALQTLLEDIRSLTERYKVMKRTASLLPNAEENMRALKELIQQSSQRLVTLGQEWESTRQPLVAKLRRGKQLLLERKDAVGLKIEQIKRMRVEAKQKAQEIKDKIALLKQLKEELAGLPKSINRQVYVKRIMDVVKNLNKQKVEIKNILESVSQVQTDINSVSQAAKRSFTLADEVVYKEAARESADNVPLAQQFGTHAYRNIVKLRDGYGSLVSQVEHIGRLQTDVRDTNAKIDVLKLKNTALNMERISDDLAQVKKENAALKNKLKKMAKQDEAD